MTGEPLLCKKNLGQLFRRCSFRMDEESHGAACSRAKMAVKMMHVCSIVLWLPLLSFLVYSCKSQICRMPLVYNAEKQDCLHQNFTFIFGLMKILE